MGEMSPDHRDRLQMLAIFYKKQPKAMLEKLIDAEFKKMQTKKKRNLGEILAAMREGDRIRYRPETGDRFMDYRVVYNAVTYRKKRYSEDYHFMRDYSDGFMISKIKLNERARL